MVKKRKKKTASKKTKKNSSSIYIKFLAVGILILGLIFIITATKYHSVKTPPETEKTEVKKLPAEIKKQLESKIPLATFKIPILMYHYVEYVTDKKDTIRQSLNINPYIFEQQIKTLKDAGYTFLTAKELGDILDGKKQMPQKPVLITFDDGHWDLYTYVLPLLRKYDVKATAYIISGFLNGSDFLSNQMLLDLSSSGYFDIGAHTVNHAWLKDRPLEFVEKEVNQSKLEIENLIHKPVVSFAYPYGAFDRQAEQVVKNDGFTTAVITVPGIDDSVTNRFFLFRIRPGGRTDGDLLNYLEQTTFRPW